MNTPLLKSYTTEDNHGYHSGSKVWFGKLSKGKLSKGVSNTFISPWNVLNWQYFIEFFLCYN